MTKVPPTELAPPTLDDDLGLQFPLPPHDPSWLNEPGTAVAGRGLLQQWTRAFADALSALKRSQAAADAAAGEHAHTLGTYLRQFRGHSAWVTLGYDSFEAFCQRHLHISERHALRLIFFAAVTTKEQARFGLRKCLAGFALAHLLEADGLGALVPTGPGWKEPAEWAARLGEPVGFKDSSATRLERLVRELTARPTLPPVAPTRRVADTVEARTKIIARVSTKHPVLDDLEVSSFARDGEARVKHRHPSKSDQFAALSAMYDALKKT